MRKKLFLLIGILYTVVLATVCLIKIKKLPEIGVSFGDKVFHFLAYMVLAFLWFNIFVDTFKLKEKKALIYAALFSIVFGIIIEVLQGTITTSRSSDVYDVMANTMGVFLTVIIVFIRNLITIKK
ncbi:VanZ family protein [Mariniflexile sp. HMF6888]|uniref:VanZ family protein n=1 Tax=Mariniflexile sp. HMF6888 TaxID=3373086 RepID=UPI0037B52030